MRPTWATNKTKNTNIHVYMEQRTPTTDASNKLQTVAGKSRKHETTQKPTTPNQQTNKQTRKRCGTMKQTEMSGGQWNTPILAMAWIH